MSRQLASLLESSGLLSAAEVAEASRTAASGKRQLLDVVLADGRVSEEQVAEAMATHLHLPFLKLATANVDPDAIKLVSETLARKRVCCPYLKEEDPLKRRRPTLTLAMADPTDLVALQDVEFASGCSTKPVIATRSEITDAIDRYYAPEKWLDSFLRNISPTEDLRVFSATADEAAEEDARTGSASVVKMVNLIIQDGIRLAASDIHIEPTLNDIKVRARVDGLLRNFMRLPKWLHSSLISRIKILAGLDIAERRRPQDGRIKVTLGASDVDLRVSSLPTHFGEKVVLRILGAGGRVPGLDTLGMAASDLQLLRHASAQPQGMILVTGPTGSGKTNSLYAILEDKKNPSINIVTVEDPIEFQLPDITQVQVNVKSGLNFAACVRSILRQDPDVILIGEIRDLETAEIAFQAAMTGHLVLATLHTNSTAATVARLLDLGVDPYLISGSVNLIVAQRLVRRICTRCKEPFQPPRAQLERLPAELPVPEHFHGRGCEACGQTGYHGRTAVFELLRMTPTLKELVGRRAPEAEIRRAALASGTSTWLTAAVRKVEAGVTTVEEVLRVLHFQEEDTRLCPRCGVALPADGGDCT
ncbi:MAG: GspE/PulE family protein, partial [Terriglobales bacterium]